ncbi:MAG: carbon starvation protein A [Alphaproteobacteria bacterium]|nr:carbon starvation protein A [Alphaproteobacteria bacterium]
MTTFLCGLFVLLLGGYIYSGFCSKIMEPDDRKTPAYRLENGLDYVPMDKHRNALIQLLNIAGTGPILGPIMGILFGPIAFILIPIGNIFAGSVHDYFCGMISIRNDGAQMPDLAKKYIGPKSEKIYLIFLALALLLVGAVFIYMPGDVFVNQILNLPLNGNNSIVFTVYGVILAYYILATLFPIDKIIGRVYPLFGGLLLLSSIAIFVGLFVCHYQLQNLDFSNWKGLYPKGEALFPAFFLTVACGITSGFHSTQTPLISRTLKDERQGRWVFYGMMVGEGLIAMIWAAAAMGIYNKGIPNELLGQPSVVGLVAKDMVGEIGGMIAIIGIILLPITSGDTALRALRIIISDGLKVDQSKLKNRLIVSLFIFLVVFGLLVWVKIDSKGFGFLWRYFAWSNQVIAVVTLTIITIYLAKSNKPKLISLIPAAFYFYVVSCYILYAKIGFNLSVKTGYIVGFILTILYIVWLINRCKKIKKN